MLPTRAKLTRFVPSYLYAWLEHWLAWRFVISQSDADACIKVLQRNRTNRTYRERERERERQGQRQRSTERERQRKKFKEWVIVDAGKTKTCKAGSLETLGRDNTAV